MFADFLRGIDFEKMHSRETIYVLAIHHSTQDYRLMLGLIKHMLTLDMIDVF